MITFEINGKTLTAEPGKTIIEVADEHNIPIPRFCYHDKLSVAANCRMCLVEVEKAPKPMPACATPVGDGMKVFTSSQKAIAAQKSVMEFLLINHPLDCPICDQGGQCELQDLAMGYGGDVSRFTEGKRSVDDLNVGPLIQTEMTRCIHCTRCVRFGEEIAGMRELGATGRGEHMTVGTYLEKSLHSELSGNVTDICPVGALTSKPFRYSARAWELKQSESIAPHDCLGSNIYLHTVRDKVKRVVPKANADINECWLSDRDRYSYLALDSEERLTSPLIKTNNTWKQASWEEAFRFVTRKLQTIVKDTPSKVGALLSPSSTVEEGYLLQKILRSFGSNNIDYRIRQRDFSGSSDIPTLGRNIASIENLKSVLLIGANPREAQPLLNLRLRKASLKGAKVSFINSVEHDINYAVNHYDVADNGNLLMSLIQVAKLMFQETNAQMPASVMKMFEDMDEAATQAQKGIAKQLLDSENNTILVGSEVLNHPHAGVLKQLIKYIASRSSASFGMLPEGANTTGLALAGVLPNAHGQRGCDAKAMLDEPLKAYITHGIEPEDCLHQTQLLEAFEQAELVVALTSFDNPQLKKHADVILPIALFAENEGTYINIEGKAQSFKAACSPAEDIKQAWKIYRVMGNLLKLEGFEFSSVKEVYAEAKTHIDDRRTENQALSLDLTYLDEQLTPRLIKQFNADEVMAATVRWPAYSSDATVRHSNALQAAAQHLPSSGKSPSSASADALMAQSSESLEQPHAGN